MNNGKHNTAYIHCDIYLSEEELKRTIVELTSLHGIPCISDSSDVSHNVYLRVPFMTVFVMHPEAIIGGWLL